MLWKLMRNWVAGVLLGVVIAALAVDRATAAEAPAEPAAQPDEAEPADPYAVPDGTPGDLAEFIERVLSTRPPNAEARVKAIAAMKEAASKILAGKPDHEQTRTALKVNLMFAQSPEALSKTIDAVKTLLAEGSIGPADAALAMAAAQATERGGNTKLAIETYKAFGKLLAKSENEQVAKRAELMEAVLRRLTLLGKDMKVEGVLFDGDALDWDSYRGKVVLVDFWATWCGPCLGEIPNMKKQYEAYHDRGFEIVGISIDRDREALEDFIEKRELPWTIVHDKGGRSPTAKYYGVTGIPTMVLVGKDGKVVSTRARGERLNEQLDKLLGPVEDESDEAEESK
ncbi:MAG: TlpA family protein disulfide reductase [Candidatus Nealsonbacteria bacterium]|nr:TlpA family protein disulfide reductase [Candidatus Nealsonbacteria bacterium]